MSFCGSDSNSYLLITTSPTTNIQHPIVNATARITTIEIPLGMDTLFPEPPPWVELPSASEMVIFHILSHGMYF